MTRSERMQDAPAAGQTVPAMRGHSKRAGQPSSRWQWQAPIVAYPQRDTMDAMMARFGIRIASRLVNALRLVRLPLHRRNVRRSRAVLRTVRGFTGPGRAGRCLCYLRRVDPLLFEEVVLSMLEDAGLFVLRNRRYTGDGGVDGAVWMPGRGWYAVQVKRYRNHICERHVGQFAEVVRRQGYAGGLFVHTGRSGAAVYSHLVAGKIILVSGATLVRLALRTH
nr:restriction endonuclease [Massilia sp. BJB1822]